MHLDETKKGKLYGQPKAVREREQVDLPRSVRSRVSLLSPTVKSPLTGSKAVTVKQHPLAAMESPIAQSERIEAESEMTKL